VHLYDRHIHSSRDTYVTAHSTTAAKRLVRLSWLSYACVCVAVCVCTRLRLRLSLTGSDCKQMYTKTSHLALSFQGSYSRKGEGSDDRYALVVWALQVTYMLCMYVCIYIYIYSPPYMFPRINVFLHMYACICISEWGSFHNAHTNTQTHTYKSHTNAHTSIQTQGKKHVHHMQNTHARPTNTRA
jgi:hypothetical protein